jgi:iron complex transport system permease protein
MVASAVTGPAAIGPGSAMLAALDRLPLVTIDSGLDGRQLDILWLVRFPRVVLGALVGAMLSLAGASFQGVFRNPLADPYLLGVAAGAGLGATIVIVSGASALLPAAAFVGAVVGVLLTYGLGRTVRTRSTTSLILAGVAVASFLTAVQTYVQQRNAETVREVFSWILGRLSTDGWSEVLLILPYVTVSATVILLHRRLLDVLALGDEEAAGLGVPITRVRLAVVAAATLGTAAAVAVGGLIGFVGIIVPHAVRLLAGSSYRVVLPLAAIVGGRSWWEPTWWPERSSARPSCRSGWSPPSWGPRSSCWCCAPPGGSYEHRVRCGGCRWPLGSPDGAGRVDLSVSQGEFVGVVGPNGAGKTTILKAMVGAVRRPGTSSIGGTSPGSMDRAARARQVAMLPQRPEVPHEMRVIDYVLLGRSPHLGYFSVEGRRDLEAAPTPSPPRAHRAVRRRLGALSGGELQRAVLARALAQASPILLLDEPTPRRWTSAMPSRCWIWSTASDDRASSPWSPPSTT